MIFQPQLRIPGPTPLPDRVLRAMSRPMIDHRGPEFAAILKEISAGVKGAMAAPSAADLLVFTASGTGAMEAAVANLISPGERVVVCTCGAFGERFADINRAFGAEVVKLEVEWGQPVEPDDLRDLLASHPEVEKVFLTHNETSTGLTNPLQALARVAGQAGKLVVVDAISSASSMPVEMEAWGLDVVISGSQKGWMSPPGLAFAAIGPRGWEAAARATSPRYYFDWRSAKTWAEKGFTPTTPSVSVAFAVQEGLKMLSEEGLSNVYARHRRLAEACVAGLQAAGLQPFAAEGYRSATVTSAVLPEGIDTDAFRGLLREKYGVVIASGRGTAPVSARIVRVGHLGAVSEGDIAIVLWAVEQALEELDFRAADGRALNAAQPHLTGTEAVAAC